MTIDKHNPTQRRQQPLSLSDALFSQHAGYVGISVRSMPNSRRRDTEEQQAFLRSILEQAIEIANDVDEYLSDEYSSDNTDGEEEEEEDSRSQDHSQ